MSNIMETNNYTPFNISQQSNNGGGTGSSSTNYCHRIVRNLLLIVVLLFVVLMLIIGIAWFVMNPHDPRFQLTALSVANVTVSDSSLTGDYNIELTVINPNKKVRVLLDEFNIWVCYGEVELSEPTVSRSPTALATYQLEMSHGKLTFPLKSRRPSPKMKHRVYGDLSAHLKKGIVNFNVKVQVRVKFEAGNWPTKEIFLEVHCVDLDVFFSGEAKGTGKLLGIGKNCSVSFR